MPETVIPFQPKDENGNLLSMKTRTNTIYKPNGDPLGDDFLGTADIANNVTTTTAGKVLDARQGKALQDQVTSLNSTLTELSMVSSSTGYTGITLYKDGLNNITIDFKNADLGTISGSSWTTILNSIPSAYRSSHDVYLPIMISTLMYIVYISATTGRVDMRSFDGTSHTVSSCNSQVNYRSV